MTRAVLRAILKDDFDGLDELINGGIDIYEVTEVERWTYVHRALISIAMPPSAAMVRRLIDVGVDVNAVDSYGNTALSYAVKLKDSAVVGALLDAGVDPQHVNDEGLTPLRIALSTRPVHQDSVKLLLDRGVDIDRGDASGLSDRQYVAMTAHDDPDLRSLFES
jgi:ankyrin repeat protein